MCSCHSILESCVTFSGVKLIIRSFVLFRTITFRQSTRTYMRVENLQPVFTADYATVDSSCLVIKFANWSW